MKKVLIANRGEIAIRVIRACKELGLKTVAVYSQADRDSLHVKMADEAVCIGPAESAKSYLSIANVIGAAKSKGADAVHPGYGFLSENAQFARDCHDNDLIFIGPKPEHMESLGNKVNARTIAKKAKVPMLPGSAGTVDDEEAALKIADEIGYPVILKAAAGGGGRGMKVVTSADELKRVFPLARREALAGFGSADVYLEKFLQKPRHIEVQIIADQHGNAMALGERDCTIQRRHQKIIEEAPSPALNPKLREQVCNIALALVKASGYQSLGTVEFLYEAEHFYFMEVNTRAQVEHPVTEMVTGLDLIKEQIKIAQGQKLNLKTTSTPYGHALECRINAEDPVSFAPWPGKINSFEQPGGLGVRVDTMLYSGYTVPPNYDSLIAKLITFGADRAECFARMERALHELKVDGIRTNIALHLRLLKDPSFMASDVSTRYLDEFVKKT
jgi:acetyl-CoA carboxylase biotin carboxylase subunit